MIGAKENFSEEENTHIANDIRTLRQLLQANQDMNDSGEVNDAHNSLVEHSVDFNYLMLADAFCHKSLSFEIHISVTFHIFLITLLLNETL